MKIKGMEGHISKFSAANVSSIWLSKDTGILLVERNRPKFVLWPLRAGW